MSVEADLLLGLQGLLQPATTTPGTLYGLSDDPDVQWALSFTRGPTDAFGRWGQGVLVLRTRGPRGVPLAVHDLAEPLLRTLLAVSGLQLGSVAVNTVDHTGSTVGPDSQRRWTRADSLLLDLDYQA